MTWQTAWRLLERRLAALSLRERGLVLGLALVSMYMLWDLAVLGPLNQREAQTLQALLALGEHSSDGESLAGTISDLGTRIQAARTGEASAEAELTALDAEFSDQTRALIAPERMPVVLRDVLARQSGLALVRLAALPSRPLVAPAPAGVATAVSGPGVFVHSFEIVLSGDYLSVVDYLRSLESMPWKVYWNRIELRTEAYPRNQVRIVVATLSLEPRGLGT